MVGTRLMNLRRRLRAAGPAAARRLAAATAAGQPPQQIEIFQSLTPEQQQQVLDQLSRTGMPGGMSLPTGQPTGQPAAPTAPTEGAIPINLPSTTTTTPGMP